MIRMPIFFIVVLSLLFLSVSSTFIISVEAENSSIVYDLNATWTRVWPGLTVLPPTLANVSSSDRFACEASLGLGRIESNRSTAIK